MVTSEAEKIILIVYSYFFCGASLRFFFTFGGLESHLKKLGEAHGRIREDSVGKG